MAYNNNVSDKRKDTMKVKSHKITIWQANEPTFMVDPAIKNYKAENYHMVWHYTKSFPTEATDIQILESTFETFNVKRPLVFCGHSLSVGDIVVVDGKAYICDSFGWNDITFEVDSKTFYQKHLTCVTEQIKHRYVMNDQEAHDLAVRTLTDQYSF